MLSSTIEELATLRADVAEKITNSSAAEAWRFESHAVAAGAPPDEQYLGIATSCDIFVLVVASQQSDATEAEYQAAYEDNPEKILVFYLGGGSQDVESFRRHLDAKHTRVAVENTLDLSEAIFISILEALESGKLLRKDLLNHVDSLIDSYRTLIADVPLLSIPHINVGTKRCPATEHLKQGRYVALSGVGGAGKSLAAAVCARVAAKDKRTLPLVTSATQECHDVRELILRRFSSIRFDATSTLNRWAREGRVFVVVDSIDALETSARVELLSSVASWAEANPRCGLVVCGRRFADQELQAFHHCQVANLDSTQLKDLLAVLGLPVEPFKVPEQVRDIASTPLWATALMTYGGDVSTGLELLQRFVMARIGGIRNRSAFANVKLREAAAALAFGLWPADEGDPTAALDILSAWTSRQEGLGRYAASIAEELVRDLSSVGLLEVGDSVAFPHRLVTTILAAEGAVASDPAASNVDDDLLPFVAALLDGTRPDTVRQILANGSIFAVARFLRLSPPIQRSAEVRADASRLALGFELWSPTRGSLSVACSGDWLAFRWSNHFDPRFLSSSEMIEWQRSSPDAVQLWAVSSLEQRSPEFIAGALVLHEFRSVALSLNPQKRLEFNRSTRQVQRLMSRPAELEALVIDAALTRRHALRTFLDALNLSGRKDWEAPQGEPCAVISTASGDRPTLSVSFGDWPANVSVTAKNPGGSQWWQSLDSYIYDDPYQAVYDETVRRLEDALGCRLGAQSWSRPELVTGWAW